MKMVFSRRPKLPPFKNVLLRPHSTQQKRTTANFSSSLFFFGTTVLAGLSLGIAVASVEYKKELTVRVGDLKLDDIIVARKFIAAADTKPAVPKTVVFVLGGPGSGKGTNCSRIVDNFGYVHLSAGDLLREERNSGSELADLINNYIAEGKIVPAEITVRLLRQAMDKSGGTKFLIDGFPRDTDNLKCWEENMPPTVAQVPFLLFLDCAQDVMTARLMERGKTSGRSDDNEATIVKRFKVYEESTRPIIDHFKKAGKIRVVDSNRDIDVVYSEVSTHFAST